MPSMANARFAALIVLILAAHVATTNLFKKTDRDVHVLVERKKDIAPVAPVNALLVGGSGMHYGLNARLLTEHTAYRFLNLGLIVEGNGWENYLSFLSDLDMIEHEKIELVVYSSADFYTLNESDEFTLTGARRGALLFDSESWLQKLMPRGDRDFGPRSADRTVIDPETGDMVFLDGVCDVYYPARHMELPTENIEEIAARARALEALFPNARILMRPWPLSEHFGPALEEIHQVLETGLERRGVEILRPPRPLYEPDWACDAAFHPNKDGRDRLTRIEAEKLLSVLEDRGS